MEEKDEKGNIKRAAPKATPAQTFCVVLKEHHNRHFPDQYFGPFVDQNEAREFCKDISSVDYKSTIIYVKKIVNA